MKDFEADIETIFQAWNAIKAGNWGWAFQAIEHFLESKRRASHFDWTLWAKRYLSIQAQKGAETVTEQTVKLWAAGSFKSRDDMKEFVLDKARDNFREDPTGALLFLAFSQNSDVVLEDGGKLYVTPNNVVDWCAIAALALAQDVHDALFNEHIWGDTEPPQEKSRWCDFCEKWRKDHGRFPKEPFVCDECSREY